MIKEIILENLKKYSKSDISDIVKLVYQNEFGGGHLIKDEELSLERIKNELNSVTFDQKIQLTEDIGNDIIRLNLAAINEKISAESINKAFILSANEIKGSVESFERKISEVFDLCKAGLTPFAEKDLCSYMDNYKKIGYPPVSHSETYRIEYSPAYRIMKKEYSDTLETVTAIKKASKNGKAVVAIDGRCASGKSTLAKNLQKFFDCNVIHMDDFFLPFEKRTPERLAEPGGNIDYERFENEVLPKIRSEKAFSYGIFNCSTGKIESEKHIYPSEITIIEGSYSLHPRFRNSFDIKVFVSTDSDTQIQRILSRNGAEMLKNFKEKWIPMEEKYFTGCKVEDIADIKITT